MSRTSPKLLYFIANDTYFLSHRLPLALAAQEEGFDVHLMTVVTDHAQKIKQAGITVWPLKHLKRTQVGIWGEIRALWEVIKLVRRIRPDVMHDVAMKPVLYGAIAAELSSVKNRVHALGGLGYLFTSESVRARFLRGIVTTLWRLFLRGPRQKMIVQNRDDYDVFVRRSILDENNIVLIAGSGVNITEFSPRKAHNDQLVIICVARMLYDKGIKELVEASRLLKQKGHQFKVQLCGASDSQNPSAIPEDILQDWHDQGLIEWLGHREDIADLYGRADIAVLPSYREGLPKSLLEAGACGLPIVTTDVPGCRDVIVNGKTGVLVKEKSAQDLAEGLLFYISNPSLRREHGARGRDNVVENYTIEKIAEQTIKLYTLDEVD